MDYQSNNVELVSYHVSKVEWYNTSISYAQSSEYQAYKIEKIPKVHSYF